MQLTAMVPVFMAGQPARLYVYDDESGNAYAFNFEGEDTILADGGYARYFDGGDSATKKRGKRLIVEGEGQGVSCLLRVEMDGGRVHTQPLTGPYSSGEGILFYTEFDPATITGRAFIVRLLQISGTGVKIGETHFAFTPIDRGG